MPSVEPLVYAGVNIFGTPSDGSAKYYFQEAVSVVQFGLGVHSGQEEQRTGETSAQNPKIHDGRMYSAHEAMEIGEVILDLQALAAEIDWTIKRAKELGFPKLSKAKGRWVR